MDIKNKLYIISLGPGDYELITLKSLKYLFKSDAILISARGKIENIRAYIILKKLFEDEYYNVHNVKMPPIIELKTSMQNKKEEWEEQARTIIGSFSNKRRILSYVTIGDVAIYSSAYYILNEIERQSKEIYDSTELVSGVSSLSYASSMVKKPLCLGGASLLVHPSESTESDNLTKVFMKPKSRSNKNAKLGDKAISNEYYYFEKLCFEGEKCLIGKQSIRPPYLSFMIDFSNGSH